MRLSRPDALETFTLALKQVVVIVVLSKSLAY